MNTYQRATLDGNTRTALFWVGVLIAGIVFIGCWDRVIAQQTEPEPATCNGGREFCPDECPLNCGPLCSCPDFGLAGFCQYNSYSSCVNCWHGWPGQKDYGDHRADCEAEYCSTSFTCERWPCACQDATCPHCTCTDWTPPASALEAGNAKLLRSYLYQGPWVSPVIRFEDGFILAPQREPLIPDAACDSEKDCDEGACEIACGAGNVDTAKSKKMIDQKACNCYCTRPVDGGYSEFLVYCKEEMPEPEGIIEDPDPVGQQRETPGQTQGLPQ